MYTSPSVWNVTGASSLQHYYPLFVLAIAGFVILFLGTLRNSRRVFASITFGALILAALMIASDYNAGIIVPAYRINSFTTFFAILFIISGLIITYPALKSIRKKGEVFYALLLFVTVGMLIAAFSYNLIVIFVAFEAVSIGTYLMTGFSRSRRALESSVKYYFVGVLSTSFIIFGLAYYFFYFGTFNLVGSSALQANSTAGLVSLAFLVAGFGFKMALFPMHQWALDTYDGAENSVSAFLSTGSKLVSFVIILKLFLVGFSSIHQYVFYFFLIISIASMTYANIAALSQKKVKRILAYSSVAQAGYLILALVVVSFTTSATTISYAVAAAMYYSLVYLFMKSGSFLAVDVAGKDDATLEDLSGLGKRSPTTAASFSILLLALAGVPLTGGFLAKFYLFLSVIQGNLWWLAVIAVINSTISVFYYLRIMVYMYARPPKENDTFVLSYKMKVPVYITAAITLALGLWYPVFNWILTLSGGLFW